MTNETKKNVEYAVEFNEEDEETKIEMHEFSVEQWELINECMVNELERELKYVVE